MALEGPLGFAVCVYVSHLKGRKVGGFRVG